MRKKNQVKVTKSFTESGDIKHIFELPEGMEGSEFIAWHKKAKPGLIEFNLISQKVGYFKS